MLIMRVLITTLRESKSAWQQNCFLKVGDCIAM